MNSTFNDHHHHHPKREPNDNSGVGIIYPPSPLLKLNKDSHVIKKPPSPSSSSSTAAKQPRQPVIIYTNTPKVIHTNPKDFMALVQKLTGMSHSEEDSGGSAITGGKTINKSFSDLNVDRKVNRNRCGGAGGGAGGHNSFNRTYSGSGVGNGKGIFFNNTTICEDSESSSVITTDENIGEQQHGHVNSSLPYSAVAVSPFPPPPPPPPPPQSMYDATAGINYSSYFSTLLPVNPADNFLCGNQNFANFDDPLYFMPNMRSSFSSSSSSGFDGLTEFRDF